MSTIETPLVDFENLREDQAFEITIGSSEKLNSKIREGVESNYNFHIINQLLAYDRKNPPTIASISGFPKEHLQVINSFLENPENVDQWRNGLTTELRTLYDKHHIKGLSLDFLEDDDDPFGPSIYHKLPIPIKLAGLIEEKSILEGNTSSLTIYGVLLDKKQEWIKTFEFKSDDSRKTFALIEHNDQHKKSRYPFSMMLRDLFVARDTSLIREITPISHKDLIDSLKEKIKSYEHTINTGGLDGALAARRQYIINEMCSGIRSYVEQDQHIRQTLEGSGLFISGYDIRPFMRLTTYDSFKFRLANQLDNLLVIKDELDYTEESRDRLKEFTEEGYVREALGERFKRVVIDDKIKSNLTSSIHDFLTFSFIHDSVFHPTTGFYVAAIAQKPGGLLSKEQSISFPIRAIPRLEEPGVKNYITILKSEIGKKYGTMRKGTQDIQSEHYANGMWFNQGIVAYEIPETAVPFLENRDDLLTLEMVVK